MNNLQRLFLEAATAEAIKANHPHPRATACEAALESNYGKSELARECFNLFGMKQHRHPIYSTMNLPTNEVLGGQWRTVNSQWVRYPDWRACFADRLATLERLSNVYPHYKAALAAVDAETYVNQVSMNWSTDPTRGEKVLSIYRDFVGQDKGESR